MASDNIDLVHLDAQEAGVVARRVKAVDLPAFLGAAFAEVAQVLRQQQVGPTGPPFGRYNPGVDGFEVWAGFPATQAVAPSGRVVALTLPGGQTARIRYRGDYAGIGQAYEEAHRWLAAHGLKATGEPWECYLDGPEVTDPRTVLHLPCGPS